LLFVQSSVASLVVSALIRLALQALHKM